VAALCPVSLQLATCLAVLVGDLSAIDTTRRAVTLFHLYDGDCDCLVSRNDVYQCAAVFFALQVCFS
jgi:hypothetical protein